MCSVYPPYYLDKKHFQISMIGVYKYVTWVFHRWGEFYAMCLKFNNSFPHETNLEFAVTHLMLFNFLFFLLWATETTQCWLLHFPLKLPCFLHITCQYELQEESAHGKITWDSAKFTLELVHVLMSQVTSKVVLLHSYFFGYTAKKLLWWIICEFWNEKIGYVIFIDK